MEFNFASVDDHLHIASENCNMLIKIRPPPLQGSSNLKYRQFAIRFALRPLLAYNN